VEDCPGHRGLAAQQGVPAEPQTAALRVPGQNQDQADTRTTVADERVSDAPVMGRIAAGVPVLAEGQVEDVIALPRLLTGERTLIALESRWGFHGRRGDRRRRLGGRAPTA
jgi:SOS-response transcriptional repressor LexA